MRHAAFRRINSEKSFAKDLACGGQLVGETEKLLRSGSCSREGLRCSASTAGSGFTRRIPVRRFEEIWDAGWGGGGVGASA